jgi:hypothetical protein
MLVPQALIEALHLHSSLRLGRSDGQGATSGPALAR